LGRLSALLWLDIFNLVQLMLVLVACAETVLVHKYVGGTRTHAAPLLALCTA
jgi:hypothetical protein